LLAWFRGPREFPTIPTTLPVVRFAEHLPIPAKASEKRALIRGHNSTKGLPERFSRPPADLDFLNSPV
jgi:hypothetical protein